MEKFFKPVHNPSDPDKIKPQNHHRHHHHHHHHHHHPQDQQSHRYAVFDEPDRNTDASHGRPRHDQHGHYHNDKPSHNAHHHRSKQHCHLSEEDEILYNNTHAPVTFSKASSSSLSSSSSSSSSSSWYTESSANDPFSLRHAERPQHSLSCSNIPDVRRGFHLDDNTDPIVFATIKHGSSGSICSELIGSSKREKCILSSLDRGHSRSDEGFLQGGDSGPREKPRATNSNYGPLNKTVSLNRSLAFSEDDSLLGVPKGPKRAVSSSQLPSKGILKNKEPHPDIRKAKSMEVLSPRVAAGQNPTGQKGKEITSAEIEQARENVVQGKLKFSAFLDEITKQVISPSDLNILGVNKNSKNVGMTSAPAQTPEPVKPQLPPKKHREGSGEEMAQHLKPEGKQEKVACSSSQKHSDCSNPDKLISYTARNHQGSPPPHHSSHSAHHGSCIKDRRPSPTGESMSEDRYGRYGPHLTDGTSTSPELIQPKQRKHRKHQPTLSHSPHSHTQYYAQPVHPGSGLTGTGSSLLSSVQAAGGGLRSESSSSRSDSSRTRDTLSTETSHSSEQSGRYSHHVGHSEQHRGSPYDTEHLQALQEENADLHQNLLQTVVCIESLEVELQRTRDELSHVKDKYKSLLETHTGTKQANNLLGEHLHIASESLSSERKYMLNRVTQLSTELEDARRTIAALQNINVPCLIKELLEKHFSSAEAIQKFLMTSTPFGHSAASLKTDNQLHCPQVEKTSCDWLSKPEAGLQQVTAFTPFKQGVPTTEIESHISDQHDSAHSPPLSVADISTAIYKKMAASYAVRPQPLYPPGQQQPSVVTNLADTPPSNLQQVHVGADSWGRKGGVEALLLEKDVVDVTSMSAQQILNDFMQQLQTHKEAGGQTQQQGGQEWVGGTEQTSRVAD